MIRDFAPRQIWSSPARRCVQTCTALGLGAQLQPDLVEQDFGQWEGRPYADLPDLGPLDNARLAEFRPPEGESFHDMVARIRPVIENATGPTLIVAHAGTVRAALSLIVGDAALSFAVAPLSMTAITRHAQGQWSVEWVNCGGVPG